MFRDYIAHPYMILSEKLLICFYFVKVYKFMYTRNLKNVIQKNFKLFPHFSHTYFKCQKRHILCGSLRNDLHKSLGPIISYLCSFCWWLKRSVNHHDTTMFTVVCYLMSWLKLTWECKLFLLYMKKYTLFI